MAPLNHPIAMSKELTMVGNYEILFRLFLAAVLGAVVGLEREIHGRPAGIRTYLLLCMGSALIMVVSELLFFKYEAKGLTDILRADPGRIAAQAITGIGFLGAGIILRYKDTIRGLTPRPPFGGLRRRSGHRRRVLSLGSTVTGLTLVSLVGLKALEQRLKKDWYKEMTVVARDEAGQLNRIQEIITKN